MMEWILIKLRPGCIKNLKSDTEFNKKEGDKWGISLDI